MRQRPAVFRSLVFAAASGLLLLAAFPHANVPVASRFVVLFALIPLFVVGAPSVHEAAQQNSRQMGESLTDASRSPHSWQSFFLSFVTGWILNLFLLSWIRIPAVTMLGSGPFEVLALLVVSAAVAALPVALVLWPCVAVICDQSIAMPSWLLAVFSAGVESALPQVVPWDFGALIALPLGTAPWLGILGTSGFSALVLWANLGFSRALLGRERMREASLPWVILLCLSLSAPFLTATKNVQSIPNGLLVGIVQPALTTDQAANNTVAFQQLLKQAEHLVRDAQRPLDLIVFPESVMPTSLGRDLAKLGELFSFADKHRVALLVQAPYETNPLEHAAASFLVQPGKGASDPIYKSHPMPFGEHIPGEDVLPWLGDLWRRRNWRLAHVVPKAGPASVVLNSIPLGVSICLDALDPARVVQQVRTEHAQLLFVQANLDWSEDADLLMQFAEVLRMRAAQFGREVVFVSPQGPSWVFNSSGQTVLSQGRSMHPWSGVVRINPKNELTFYAWWGNFPLFIVLCGGIVWTSRRMVCRADRRKK